MPIVDIIPVILAKGLNKIVYIFEDNESTTLITKLNGTGDHTKPVLLRKRRDHYDALSTKCIWRTKKFKSSLNETCILRIPYINEHHKRNIKKIIRESELAITPIFTSGPQLSQKLIRSALSSRQCTLKGCIVNSTICYAKNVIYEAKCAICNDVYVGETKRFLHLRAREHLTNIRKNNIQASALALHFYIKHRHEDIPDVPFTIKIIQKAKDTPDRKIREALLIRQKEPQMNRDKGWDILHL